MKSLARSSVVTLACLAAFSVCAQTAVQPLATGSPAPAFSLAGTDGALHTLADWKDSPVLVVAFLCNHCTESQLYEGRLNGLAARYSSHGVAVVAIQSTHPEALSEQDLAWSDVGETLADMTERATYRKFQFPYLYDGDTGKTAAAFGASVAPSVFIFDKERKLRYSGRIDDDPANGPNASHDAAAAIDALLAGKQVSVPSAPAAGCSLKIAAGAAQKQTEKPEPVTVALAPAETLTVLRHNPTGKLLLVNFYATWCGPCVTEFPDLMATNRMYRGRPFSFTTVSSNVPAEEPQVLKFLQKMHASTSNLLYGTDDTYAMQDAFDPELGAAVPVTVLLGPRAEVLFHEQGEIDLMEIRRAILANLPDDAAHAGSQKYWASK